MEVIRIVVKMRNKTGILNAVNGKENHCWDVFAITGYEHGGLTGIRTLS